MAYQGSATCDARSQPSGGAWPRKFTEVRKLDLESLNRPEIVALWDDLDMLDEQDDEGEGSDSEGSDSEHDKINEQDEAMEEAEEALNRDDFNVASVFMKARCHSAPSETSDESHRGTDVVVRFCGHIHFHDLQGLDTKTKPLALLEESSHTGVSRESRGPIDEIQLYTALKEPRFAGAVSQRPLKAQPDADQRRLYIHNITPLAAAAIMATASTTEAPAVKDLLYLHLSRITSIGVDIPSRGLQTFTFRLSIPYYILGGNCHPSRYETLYLPGLRVIYKAQITIILTGVDERRWTAIALADSTRVGASVEKYKAGLLPDRVQREDPVVGTKLSSNNNAFDPRLFFLWTWEERIRQAWMEWELIVRAVEQTVKEIRTDLSLILISDHSDEKIRRMSSVISTRILLANQLNELKLTFSNTVHAWQQFHNGDIKYFRENTSPLEAEGAASAVGRRDSLQALEETYAKLQEAQRRLDASIGELKDSYLNNEVATLVSLQSLNLAQRQEALERQSGLSGWVRTAIAAWLGDKHRHVRSTAAEALGRQSSPSQTILGAIAELPKDESGDVRYAAAETLRGHSASPDEIAQTVATYLKHQEGYVRRAAAEVADGPIGEDSKSDSVESELLSSGFDRDDQSRGTYPSTVPTLQSGPHLADNFSPEAETKHTAADDSDADTTYSNKSQDDSQPRYIQAFIDQLTKDTENTSTIPEMATEYLDQVLRAFAWKLHGESSDPFQWETAVFLNQNRTKIINLLASKPQEDDEMSERRQSFEKPPDMVHRWIHDVEPSDTATEESRQPDAPIREDDGQDIDTNPATPNDQSHLQLADYEFIRESDAYRWLLSKIRQHERLAFGTPNLMHDIGVRIQEQLREQKPLRKMSRRKPLYLARMTFNLDWELVRFIRHHSFAPPFSDVFDKILCPTGSWDEAQAATVMEYMSQIWPGAGDPIVCLLKKLISLPEGGECSYQLPEPGLARLNKPSPSLGTTRPGPKMAQLTARIQPPSSCYISATGDRYFVSEIAEQIGWLASALRLPRISQGLVACYPYVEDLNVKTEGASTAIVMASCCIKFHLKEAVEIRGFCSGLPVFCSPILVRGYPVLRGPAPKPVLEILGIVDGDGKCRVSDGEKTEPRPAVDDFMSFDMSRVQDQLSGRIDSLRLIPYDPTNTPSIFDGWRIRFEEWLGYGEIDWFPLPPVNRLPLHSQAKLSWRYGGTELSTILNEEETKRCRGKVREVAECQPGLPGPVTSAGSGSRSQSSKLPNSVRSWLPQKLFGGPDKSGDGKSNAPREPKLRHSSTENTRKDSFLCVDKVWSEAEETRVSTIAVVEMTDDYEFYTKVMKLLQDAQGGWLQRLVSWKSYNKVEFSKFFFIPVGTDRVITHASKLSDCTEYEYDADGLDADIHMRMVSETIREGVRNPLLGRGCRYVLRGIPKRPAPPILEGKPGDFGWAFHPKQCLCLRRILYWVNGIVALGITFVPFWLGAINKLDLQNAFAPVTFLGMLVALWIATAALGHAL